MTLCILAIGALLVFAGYQRSAVHIGSIRTPARPASKVRAAWSMLVGPQNFHGANRRMVNPGYEAHEVPPICSFTRSEARLKL